MGVRAVIAARRVAGQGRPDAEAADPSTEATQPQSPLERWRSGFAQEFFTNVLNPKAAMFFLSILHQFVSGGGSMTRQIFFLGILNVLIAVAAT
ncbi:LysE family transporter [Streptomyces californicus]|uniref:LysE family transporter n=1 Tax=Streptomyces californicus TaxID=67351 RepID=UPI00368E826F